MPFGKYRGWLVSDLPMDYLFWLRSLPDLRPNLKSAIEWEWTQRLEADERSRRQSECRPSSMDRLLGQENSQLFIELVQAGRRALALKYHPDRNGDSTQMARLNDFVDRLLVEVKR